MTDPADPWRSLLEPRTVCVVGASSDPQRIGGRLVRYSLEAGFAGRIIPVNPNRDSIFGVPTVPSLADLDIAPDWAVLAVGRDKVADAVEQAGRIGTRNVAILSAGFAEADDEGRQLQLHLAERARAYGMRLLGPNCNGFMLVDEGAFFAFTPVIDSARPTPGKVAIITQSAAVGTYLINWFHQLGLGIRYWFHTGNEADLTALDIARLLAERDEVSAVALCLETVRDQPMLRQTLATLAEHDLATGLLYSGTSETGQRASAAHTAALVGDEAAVISDLCVQAGAFAASSIRELTNFLQFAVNPPRVVKAPRVGFVTTSGGVGVLMADALDDAGLLMPPLSDQLQTRILTYAPYAHPGNPIDTTAQVGNERKVFERVLTDCTTSGELDVIAAFIAHGLAGADDWTLQQVISVSASVEGEQSATLSASLAAVGVFAPDAARALHEAGIPAFSEPADLAHALAGYADAAERRRSAGAGRTADQPGVDVPPEIVNLLSRSGTTEGALLDEIDAKEVLSALGVSVPRGVVATDRAHAAEMAQSMSYPLVAKLVSPQIPHKAEVGGLILGLMNSSHVSAAFDRLHALGVSSAHGRGEFRILVEEQSAGREVFLSCTRHAGLGLVVAIGPGGSGVEEQANVTWSWPPLNPDQVLTTLSRTGLLDVKNPADAVASGQIAKAANTLAGLAQAMPALTTIEINPLIVAASGLAFAADALVVITRPGPSGEVGSG